MIHHDSNVSQLACDGEAAHPIKERAKTDRIDGGVAGKSARENHPLSGNQNLSLARTFSFSHNASKKYCLRHSSLLCACINLSLELYCTGARAASIKSVGVCIGTQFHILLFRERAERRNQRRSTQPSAHSKFEHQAHFRSVWCSTLQ